MSVFYTRWAYSKGLMSFENEQLQNGFLKNREIKEKLKLIRKIIGKKMLRTHLSKEGFLFTIEYYRPGWKYFYFEDFGSCFPDCDDEEDVPDTPESYAIIENLLNKRFDEWLSEHSHDSLKKYSDFQSEVNDMEKAAENGVKR